MEDYEPERYANADKIVAELKAQQAAVWAEVLNRTLCSHTEWDGMRVHTVAPRVAYLVEEADEVSRSLDREIDSWQMRGRLYKEYIAAHPHPDSEQMQDELAEIDTYVCYQHGIEPPAPRLHLTGDTAADLQSMADYFD